jgi:cytochrome c556
MTSFSKLITRALCLSLLVAAVPAIAATPLEIIQDRQANQKRVGDIADALKKAIADKTAVSTLVPMMEEFSTRAHRLRTLFPEGTETGGNTKAKPEIWTDRAGYDVVSTNYEVAVDKLASLAKAGDDAGFAEQFKATGATCGACHRGYRNR